MAPGAAHRLTPVLSGTDGPLDPDAAGGAQAPVVPSEVVSDATAQARLGDALQGNMRHNYVLAKGKTLRASPSKWSKSLGTIQQYRPVIPLGQEEGGGKLERSWVKVRGRTENGPLEGWINTKDSVEDAPLAFSGGPEAIMSKSGPRPDDVKQGSFGDCYLMAPLLSLVQRNPSFVQNHLFRTDPTEPADSYTLEFHKDAKRDGTGPFSPERVTVKPTVLRHQTRTRTADGNTYEEGAAYGADGPALWPAIVEKAFLAWPGRNRRDDEDAGVAFRASGNLTGFVHHNRRLHAAAYELKDDPAAGATRIAKEADAIIEALANEGSGALTASTVTRPPTSWAHEIAGPGGASGEMMVGGIAFNHVYSIVNANERTVTVRNPWGKYGRVNGKVDPEAAESVLTWDEFATVFGSWCLRAEEQPKASGSGGLRGRT